MTVTLTEEKVRRILSVCATPLKTQMPTIRQVAKVIGILVSNFPGGQHGPLHYRHLERDKYLALIEEGRLRGENAIIPSRFNRNSVVA